MKRTLREWRIHFGYSQEEFAEAVGVTTGTISAWEKDPEMIRMRHVKRITKLFNIKTDDIIFLSDNRNLLTKERA